MKLETTVRQLRSALGLVGRAIERSNTYPVLGCVLIDGATLRGTNLDMEITAKVAASHADGLAAIDFYRLRNLVRGIDLDAVVRIEAGESGATVAFPEGRYDLPACDVQSYPVMPTGAEGARDKLQGFDEALAFVAPFISDEETRYYLDGFCFSRDADGNAVLVTTDGHRMGVHPLPCAPDVLQGKIVPRDTARALLRMPGAETMSKYADKEYVRFDWPGVSLTSKLIDGTFPDWRRVLPKVDEAHPSITLPRARMNTALYRLQLFCAHHTPFATMSFDGTRAVVTIKHHDTGAAREYLPDIATTNAGDGKVITFRADYLRDILRVFGNQDHIRVAFEDGGHLIRITAAGAKAFAVLMPARGSDDNFAVDALREMSVPLGRAA